MIKYLLISLCMLLLSACDETTTQITINNQLNGIKIEQVKYLGYTLAYDLWPSGNHVSTYYGQDHDIFDSSGILEVTLVGAIGEIRVQTLDTIRFTAGKDTSIIIDDSTKFRNNF